MLFRHPLRDRDFSFPGQATLVPSPLILLQPPVLFEPLSDCPRRVLTTVSFALNVRAREIAPTFFGCPRKESEIIWGERHSGLGEPAPVRSRNVLSADADDEVERKG